MGLFREIAIVFKVIILKCLVNNIQWSAGT